MDLQQEGNTEIWMGAFFIKNPTCEKLLVFKSIDKDLNLDDYVTSRFKKDKR